MNERNGNIADYNENEEKKMKKQIKKNEILIKELRISKLKKNEEIWFKRIPLKRILNLNEDKENEEEIKRTGFRWTNLKTSKKMKK